VATSLKLECVKNVKTKMSQTFHGTWELEAKGDFFRKPPAFHRLPFMPQFAGDIRARAGYLKWTAQIPRKAYRWALRVDLTNCFLALNVGDQELEELFFMSSTKHKQLEGLPRIVRPKDRAKITRIALLG